MDRSSNQGPIWNPPTPPPVESSLAPPQLYPPGPPAFPASSPPPPTAAAAVSPTPPGDRRGRWWVALLAGLILGGLFTMGGFWLGSRSDDQPTAAPLPVVATAPATADPKSEPASTPAPAIVDEDAPEPVAAVAAAVSPSVVGIVTTFGEGSGISYTDSLLITNAHVVGDASSVTVLLADGREVDGTVVGTDPSRDVAVVEVSDATLRPAVFAPSSSVEVGQLAVAIGSPFGLEQSVTSGIVSALNRVVPSGVEGAISQVSMVQTDAPINPGNSGGALVDRQGRVIGMNTSIRTAGGVNASVGVGFAVPSDTMLLIADRIVSGESLETGFLGVSLNDSVVDPIGALVTEVSEGTAAEKAGIEVGDVIIGIAGDDVDSTVTLAAKIQLRNPGEVVEVELVRDGETLLITATLGSNESN
ncbi:MAG: trypsin-like peptidase domain-containing protein [Acidimicrobiales bacterium]